ncbi:unnamed protein product [Euphydryas editha]|uniref:Uncharacterized protein n=1 Tax=Euphydryas editha TaxID=104508 RepID=A0AAU9UIP9_EUPED|nr:unnamed protein product [Euphydryas editha]
MIDTGEFIAQSDDVTLVTCPALPRDGAQANDLTLMSLCVVSLGVANPLTEKSLSHLTGYREHGNAAAVAAKNVVVGFMRVRATDDKWTEAGHFPTRYARLVLFGI